MKTNTPNWPLRGLAILLGAGLLTLVAGGSAAAQATTQVVHLARLEIYPAQLEKYRAALKEHIETALRVEPGVLTLHPLADAAHPSLITVLEIYASPAAYQAHLQSPHFLKYKSGTKAMVKSLELIDTTPLLPDVKVKNQKTSTMQARLFCPTRQELYARRLVIASPYTSYQSAWTSQPEAFLSAS